MADVGGRWRALVGLGGRWQCTSAGGGSGTNCVQRDLCKKWDRVPRRRDYFGDRVVVRTSSQKRESGGGRDVPSLSSTTKPNQQFGASGSCGGRSRSSVASSVCGDGGRIFDADVLGAGVLNFAVAATTDAGEKASTAEKASAAERRSLRAGAMPWMLSAAALRDGFAPLGVASPSETA